jgi:flagellar hook protein FlgE
MPFSAMNTARSGLEGYDSRFNDHSQNLAAAGAVSGKARETFLTALAPPVTGSLNPPPSGIVGTLTNHISAVGVPVQSEIKSHLCINGQGMMMVKDSPTGENTYYTRVGTINFDQNKKGTNHLGKFVQVFDVNQATGAVVGSTENDLISLDLTNAYMSANATSNVAMSYHLNSQAQAGEVVNTTMNVFDSEGASQSIPITLTCVALDSTLLSGNLADNVASAWALNINPSTSSGITVDELYSGAQNNATDSTGTLGMIVQFDTQGRPIAFQQPTGATNAFDATPPNVSFTWPPTGIPTTVNTTTVALDLGSATDESKLLSTGSRNIFKSITSNGNGFGEFRDFHWDEFGYGQVKYSNGYTKPYCLLPLATFNNTDGLEPLRDSMYWNSRESGAATITRPGEGKAGTIAGSYWESSTTNGVDVYVKMIQDQKFYMGQLKVITTSKEMIDALERL